LKLLKNFAGLLKRREGLSLIAIVALIVIMSVMGGVFSHIMGRWKLSAPATMNSSKALYLAETAVMFALQDAKYRFYGGSFNYGTSGAPYIVHSTDTEEANYWFERPDLDDNGSDDDSDDGGSDDDSDDDGSDDDSDDDGSDDDSDDDADDDSNPTRYTIIATGKVIRDGATVAKRQIKIKADITPNTASPVEPGLHTEGSIRGSGSGAFNIWKDGLDMSSDPSSVAFSSGTYANSSVPPSSGSRDGAVYQTPADEPPDLDEEFFKAMAEDQGHYNPAVVDNYPNSSYYYDAPTNTIPNITYISGDLSPCNNKTIYGIYWVQGDVSLGGNFQVNGIIICEGDVKMNGGGSMADPNMDGGIIQYGSSNELWAAGNPSIIQINDDFFDAMNNAIPIITVKSWQEAVSAN